MANVGYVAPTANFTQTTLNGAITSGAGTITVNSVAGLQAPGYIVVDRTDSAGTATPNNREVISYTGISGSNLTGCVRGADNSTARAHSDGAIVEANPTVGMWNDLATIVYTGMGVDGYLRAINSPVSISQVNTGFFIAISGASINQGQFISLNASSIASIARIQLGELVGVSGASIQDLRVSTRFDVSAASVTGIGLYPTWRTSGAISGATTSFAGLMVIPKVATLNWVSVVTRTVASGTSVVFDMKNNGTTIFPGVTAPTILAGGTYISTASIGTKALSPGNILTVDVKTMAAGVGVITDVTLQGGTI